MKCTTDAEIILKLHHHILAYQGLEKGVEEHHGADLFSSEKFSGQSELALTERMHI